MAQPPSLAHPPPGCIHLLPAQVKANGLIVFVPKFGIEGPVFLTARPGQGEDNSSGTFLLDEKQQAVSSRCVCVAGKVWAVDGRVLLASSGCV